MDANVLFKLSGSLSGSPDITREKMRDYVIKYPNVTYSSLADAAGVHPNTVNNVLNGTSDNTAVKIVLLQLLCGDNGLYGLAQSTNMYETVKANLHCKKNGGCLTSDIDKMIAQLRGGEMATASSGTQTEIPLSKPESDVLKRLKELESKFPIQDAQRLAKIVRAAQKEKDLPITFSLRKLIMWAQFYELARRELELKHAEALEVSFHTVALAKSNEEVKKFLLEAYAQIFGKTPELKLPRNKTGHPQDILVKLAIDNCIPIWLVGPTGCGKTHTVLSLMAEAGRKIYRVQGCGDMTIEDFIGGWGAKDGSTQREYGMLPLAMQEGGVLLIDEITATPAEILFELHAVLEGNALTIKSFRGEVIEAAPGFTVVACDNTIGMGESLEYVGTNPMNEAFRDRFMFVHYDYMPEKTEANVLKQHIDKFAFAWKARNEVDSPTTAEIEEEDTAVAQKKGYDSATDTWNW